MPIGPGYTGPSVAAGKLFVMDRSKILEPTGAARGRKIVWSHPAFSNGQMFARNDKEIICVDLKKK
jgi:hypothetical protein